MPRFDSKEIPSDELHPRVLVGKQPVDVRGVEQPGIEHEKEEQRAEKRTDEPPENGLVTQSPVQRVAPPTIVLTMLHDHRPTAASVLQLATSHGNPDDRYQNLTSLTPAGISRARKTKLPPKTTAGLPSTSACQPGAQRSVTNSHPAAGHRTRNTSSAGSYLTTSATTLSAAGKRSIRATSVSESFLPDLEVLPSNMSRG